jgi:hypothetical protein
MKAGAISPRPSLLQAMSVEFLLTSLIVVLIPGTGVLYTVSSSISEFRCTPAFMLDTFLLATENPIQEQRNINGEGTHPIHCTPDRNGLRTAAGRVDERRNS